MLYQKARDIADAFETVGKPAAFEYKYDGFRMQIHKTGGVIRIFTRNLEEVTTQFPDVVTLIKTNVAGDDFILDAEAIGWNTTTQKFAPFQEISQRIKRKHGIAAMANELPVIVVIFDILAHNGRSLLATPYAERRALLEQVITRRDGIGLSEQIITDDETAAQRFYHTSLEKGNEGIMAKKLDAGYQPGARVGSGVKIKPVMETLDVAIVGAEWGEGKRGKWLASFTVAVRDPATGELVQLGHVGTGIKEKEDEGLSFGQLTELLLPHVISEDGRAVKVTPTLVIEIAYEEIQASPSYSSGYALRFPRFVRLRSDRGLMDISTTEDVERLYRQQRGRGKAL
jgi:DNA ligase-1